MARLSVRTGERCTVPNRQIIGEILANSERQRIVETKLRIGYDVDPDRAVAVLRAALAGEPILSGMPPPQIGIDDFAWGGVVIGLRYWVPSREYFPSRYAVNRAARAALQSAGIDLLPAHWAELIAPPPKLLTEPPPSAQPPSRQTPNVRHAETLVGRLLPGKEAARP